MSALCVVFFLLFTLTVNAADGDLKYYKWNKGKALFYGGENGQGANWGACGYGIMNKTYYGNRTVSVSSPLWKDGQGCGACYELKCVGSNSCRKKCTGKYCIPYVVQVTTTNFCPPYYGNTCCMDCGYHFDLTVPAYKIISSNNKLEDINILFQRIPCKRNGYIKFDVKTAKDWISVLVKNVNGSAEIGNMEVKPSDSNKWLPMKHDYGANWVYFGFLKPPLLFRLTSRLDNKKIVTKPSCLPAKFSEGTYDCGVNFKT